MAARILILSHDGQTEIPFDQQLTIGRDVYNALCLQDPDISRSHAILFEQDGRALVKDLNSRNGIYVNGTKTTEAALVDGDEIVMGSTVLIFNPAEGADLDEALSERGKFLLKRSSSQEREKRIDAANVFTAEQMDRVVHRLFNNPESGTFFSLSGAVAMLRAFYEMTVASDASGLFRASLRRAMEIVGGDRGVIMEASQDKRKLKVRSILAEDQSATKIELPQQALKYVLKSECCVYCSNVATDPRFADIAKQGAHPIHSFIAAPIICAENYFGFIYLDSADRAREFDYAAMRSLYFIASTLASLLQPRAMHFERRAEESKAEGEAKPATAG